MKPSDISGLELRLTLLRRYDSCSVTGTRGGARDAKSETIVMMPKPSANIAPNTLDFEIYPLVKPTGFREYDARWWFNGIGDPRDPELNLEGVKALGLGMATLFHELGV
ncbi:MAG: hypothetical protein AAFQ84_11475, partial [Pseudomonadota bacterium]